MNELLILFEKYYNLKYNDLQRDVLLKYLDGKEEMFKTLFDRITTKHEIKWKTLPDKAMIDKEIQEIIKEQKKIIEDETRMIEAPSWLWVEPDMTNDGIEKRKQTAHELLYKYHRKYKQEFDSGNRPLEN